MRHKPVSALLAIVTCVLISMTFAGADYVFASSVTITFNFKAIVDSVNDPSDVLGGEVGVGDMIEGSYTFDTTQPNVGGTPDFGRYYYEHVPGEFELTARIGALTWTTIEEDPFNESTIIYVKNDSGVEIKRDEYFINSLEVDGPGKCVPQDDFILQIALTTFANLGTFTSVDLPLTPPDLLDFEENKKISIDANFDQPPGCPDYDNYRIVGYLTELSISPIDSLEGLIAAVVNLNISHGISNSLDSKLDQAQRAIEDLNQNNDVSCTNTLEAFINAVLAQRGDKIPEEDADALIAAAQAIIEGLASQ